MVFISGGDSEYKFGSTIYSLGHKSLQPNNQRRKIMNIRLFSGLLLTCTFVFCLSACQPTPEEKLVINKADDAFINKIEKSDVPRQKYQAPKQWKEDFTYQDGQLTVHLDASIVVPPTNAYPVVRIVPGKFNIEQAETLCHVLLPGKTLYEPQQTKSKDDIQNKILKLEKQLHSPSAEVLEMKERQPDAYKQYLSNINQQIKSLEDEFGKAPEANQREIAKMAFQQDSEEINDGKGLDKQDIPQPLDRKVLNIETDIDKKIPTTLNIWSYDNDHRNFAEFLCLKDGENPVNDLSLSDNIQNLHDIKMTEAQAANTANKVIAALGLTDMTISAAASGIIENERLFKQGATLQNMPQCYVFYYTRNIDGVPTTYTDINAPKGDYAEPWPYERIKSCVYDSGINELYWVSPAIVQEKVTDNAALLSFDQIQSIFKKQIAFKAVFTGYKDNEASIQRTMRINKITLGMARIEEKDKNGQYLMIPVWDFFGSYTDQYPKEYKDTTGLNLNRDNQITFSTFAHSFLTINAIDGSVIDRYSGY
jgi:hypothetical protein